MNTFKFSLKRNIVWSPHFYPLSFAPSYFPENATRLEADLAVKYAKFVLELGTPIWIGEFGAFMKDDSHVDWLKDATRLFGKYQLGLVGFRRRRDQRQGEPILSDSNHVIVAIRAFDGYHTLQIHWISSDI